MNLVLKMQSLRNNSSALLNLLLDLLLHLLGLQLLHGEQTDPQLVLPGEGLRHQPQPLPADLHRLLSAQVGHAVLQVLLDPLGQLALLVLPAKPLVCHDHDPIVSLASEHTTNALSSVSHGVKSEEVVLPDLELVPQVLEPCL